jgi:hypothetical protein
MVRDTPLYGHAHTNYLSMNSFVGFIWIIWPGGQRSRSHKGHYCTRHTALWSCTYELSSNKQFCWIYLNYFTFRSKVKVITACDTPPYGHTSIYQLSFTYLERQKCYGPDKNILFKKQLFDLDVKGQGPMKVITVCDTHPYGHAYTNYLSVNSFVVFIWTIWPWSQRSRSH